MQQYAAEPELHRLAENVYGYVQLDGSWGLNNSGFVVGDDQVAVIDTTVSESRTNRLIETIRTVTDLPINLVLNTHHHRDHTSGNYLFDRATIIGHRRCRDAVIRDGVGGSSPIAVADPGNLELAPPNVVFDDAITCHLDPLVVDGYFVGPAHTDNDAFFWLEEQRVLFAGDVLIWEGTPLFTLGSLAGSLDAIERLRALRPEVVVPGHGPIGGPEILDDVEEYVRLVEATAAEGFEEGLSPMEAARRTDLGRFASWNCSERLVANVHRAYMELEGQPRGAPIEMAEMFAEMGRFKSDGPLVSVA